MRETPLSVAELFFNAMPMSHKDFIVWRFEAERRREGAEEHSRKNSHVILSTRKRDYRNFFLIFIARTSTSTRSHKETEHANRIQGREWVSTCVPVYVSRSPKT